MKTVNTCILPVVHTVHPRCHDTVICQGFHLNWSLLILSLLRWTGLAANLFYICLLMWRHTFLSGGCFEKLQTHLVFFKKKQKTNNKRLVRTSTRSSITLTAALKPAVENFNSKLGPRAKRTTPAPFQTTLCLLSVSKVYHTHPHTHSGPASARVLGWLPLPKATGRLQPACLCVWYERMHVRHKNSIWKLLSSPIRDGCASARRRLSAPLLWCLLNSTTAVLLKCWYHKSHVVLS